MIENMKSTIMILMRHAIPQNCHLASELIPLSSDGVILANLVRKEISQYPITKCYTSPYLRARQTANILCSNPIIIENIHERIIGDETADFWFLQYQDYDYKNKHGESLAEVKVRMKHALDIILDNSNENEYLLVISHATAICSYLLNYCQIKVTDRSQKSRLMTFNDKIIIDGKIRPCDYFILHFMNHELTDIAFKSHQYDV